MAHQTENRVRTEAPMPPLALVVAPLQSSVAKEWRRYDRMHGPSGHRALDAIKLASGESVLDVGCGAGGLTLEAAHRVGATGAAAGIDPDPEAIRVAKIRAREQHLGWTSFAAADPERAELPGWAFDAIVSRFGISALREPERGLSRLARCLVPGGRIAFVCWRSPGENPWFSLARDAVAECFGAEVAASVGVPRAFAFADRDLLAGWLARAGFVDVSVEPFDSSVWLGDDIDDALEFFFETDGRPLDDRLDDKGIARLTRELRRALTPHERHDGVWLGAGAWLVGAKTAPTLLAG